MKKKIKSKTLSILTAPAAETKKPEFLTIKNAGLLDGKFSIELSNGCFLKGVTKIVTETPRYQDGVELHLTVFVDTSKPIAVNTTEKTNEITNTTTK